MLVGQQLVRRLSKQVKVGSILIGGEAPIRVQSMTDTNTADCEATVNQIKKLVEAGSELVRITVNDEAAAQQVPYIKETLLKDGIDTPIVGDFHYNGHILLTKYEECAKALDKFRINPGNVGFGEKHDKHFAIMIEQAIKFDKPVRIGVNWGSLDQDLIVRLMDENSKLSNPKSAEEIQREALIISALSSAKLAEKIGLKDDRIIVSCKVSRVQDLISLYRELARKCDYALHLGLTEAGMGMKGIISSTAALSVLLQEGIGDTIRVSITPEANAARDKEVHVARQILQSMGLRTFSPQVSSCPGCGRTSSAFFRELAEQIQNYLDAMLPVWREKYIGIEKLNVAVMGCIVNGPGESKHSNIGISLPGNGENPAAPVFIDGEKRYTLRGDDIVGQFKEIVEKYVEQKYV